MFWKQFHNIGRGQRLEDQKETHAPYFRMYLLTWPDLLCQLILWAGIIVCKGIRRINEISIITCILKFDNFLSIFMYFGRRFES